MRAAGGAPCWGMRRQGVIDYEEARALVLERATTRGFERMEVARAVGRVLAQDVIARIASPPFNKSAMDGYAIRQADVAKLPAELVVIGEIFAGQAPDIAVGAGQAVAISTGAPVPTGADMVVMLEDTKPAGKARIRAGKTRICVLKLSGPNICPAGEDARAGETVLRAGQVLTPLRVGVAAAAGHAVLAVHRRPTGALICTGTEVVEPGRTVPGGKICNANGPMLSSLMAPVCREFAYLGIVGDDEEELAARVRDGLKYDVLILSGGVSVGKRDLVPGALEQAGVEQAFHEVAIKPGKPVLFGTAGPSLVFGMPGNPQSCFVVFHMLVAPAIAAMSGASDLPPFFEEGVMAEGFGNKPERMNVMPCMVERREGLATLRRCHFHGAADIMGPSTANAYVIVPRGVDYVQEGQKLRFFRI